MKFYCVKCRESRKGIDLKEITLKDNKSATKATYEVCGTAMFKLNTGKDNKKIENLKAMGSFVDLAFKEKEISEFTTTELLLMEIIKQQILIEEDLYKMLVSVGTIQQWGKDIMLFRAEFSTFKDKIIDKLDSIIMGFRRN